MAIWSAEDGDTWTQAIAASNGKPIGDAMSLGRLGAGEQPLSDQPLAVPLPGGDLALIGVTANGRITFARGSENAARRISPMVAVPATQDHVAAIAAGASDDGVVLALLRGPRASESGARKASNTSTLELHWLGPRGQQVRPPVLRVTAADASSLHVSRCADSFYVASSVGSELFVQRVDREGAGAPERHVKTPSLTGAGALYCMAERAIWIAGTQSSPTASSLASTLMLRDLTQLDSIKAGWRRIKLPAPPRTALINGERLASHARDGGLDLLVARKVTSQLVHLDLVDRLSKPEPALDVALVERECVLSKDTQLAVCASARPRESGSGCSNMPARVDIAVYGTGASAPALGGQDFWKSGVLADVDAPSEAEMARRASRLSCGEPGWEKLRKALEVFCRAHAAEKAGNLHAFCAADQEGALLYQATHCTNLPKSCPTSRRAIVPSVDRSEYERGERVELSAMGCSVWFTRQAGEFQVVDRECGGD